MQGLLFMSRGSTTFGRTARRALLSCVCLLVVAASPAAAQAPQQAVDPLEEPRAQSETAPSATPPEAQNDKPVDDWRAWRVFYDRLERDQRDFPGDAQATLVGRISLTDAQADVVLAEGFAYLDELRRIYDEEQSYIVSRYGPKNPDALASIDYLKAQGRLPPDFVPIPAYTPDGRPLKEALAADGFFDRHKLRHDAVFRAHWESLAESIGLHALVRLERYIKEEVVPGIQVTPSPPPPPLPFFGGEDRPMGDWKWVERR